MMTQELINQGRTAEVFDIGNNQIMKLFRQNLPAQLVETEFNIAAALKDYDLPIPRFYGKVEQEGRMGLIYENIKGLSMLRLVMVKPRSFVSLARQMAEIHSQIHQTKIKGIPLQKEQLEFSINQCPELSDQIKEQIIHRLKELPTGDRLCHGDFHPDNILYSQAGKPVVIDWMTGAIGDPAGDVARTKVILKLSKAPSHLPFMIRIVANLLKSVLCHTYIKYYIQITGIPNDEIRQWELPIAAARLLEGGPNEEKKALLKFIHQELKNQL